MQDARRLFILKQHLQDFKVPGTFGDKVTSLIRDIGYIQWDPVSVVVPSHLISLWSRIGNFDHNELDTLMWKDRDVFLHWTPIAILALTEDYPAFYSLMKRYPDSLGKSWRSHIEPARKFIDSHEELREKVLERLKDSPADISAFRDLGKRDKITDGWSSGNEITTLLYHLHMMGEVMVSGHSGNQNTWALSDQFLPRGVDKTVLPVNQVDKIAAERSVKALGVARQYDINRYFVRGRYSNLGEALSRLEEDSRIIRVEIEGEPKRDAYYVHSDDVKLLERIGRDRWHPRIKLISPFDNLITIRERTRRMFSFDYTLEQFVPKEKRKYGTYVLPVLWDDRLVGRIDAKLERDRKTLLINSVHAEKGFEESSEIPERLSCVINEFADFLGASTVTYGRNKPQGWERYLT